MHFKQFYLGCLAHASYLVGDEGVCAIVDPQRDVDGYIDEADRLGLSIRHVIETHVHADFVSGHLELARRTGATVHVGHQAQATYPCSPAHDGDEIVMGRVLLRFLETPGHTPESMCVLVCDRDQDDRPIKILTGDTLFIGDVGRPDLVGSQGHTPEQMASMMYDSLHAKILPLPEDIEVCPAHGAGSACGRNISDKLTSTLREQRATNWALADMTREQFAATHTSCLMPPPAYFAHDADINRHGAGTLADLERPSALAPDEVQRQLDGGALLLDVRDGPHFASGHVRGAFHVGLGGNFASWCGTLLPVDASLVIVADDDEAVDEVVLRLARVGLHGVVGHLAGGIEAWERAGRSLQRVTEAQPQAIHARQGDSPLQVLDVRGPGEFEQGHVPGAVNIPLPQLAGRCDELDPQQPWAVVCKSGYRSSAACSLLARNGFAQLVNVVGGTDAWIAAGLDVDVEADDTSFTS